MTALKTEKENRMVDFHRIVEEERAALRNSSHVAIDFETFYDAEVSITELGGWAYLHHPRCLIYLVAIFDGENKFVGDPRDFDWSSIKGRTWVSHNRSFDKLVWATLVEFNQIEPDEPAVWECTADMSVYLRAPRNLKGAVKQLLGRDISKDVRNKMKGLTPDDMKSRILQENGKFLVIDPSTYAGRTFWDDVCDYAGNDVVDCWELWTLADPHADPNFPGQVREFPERERRLSRMTTEQGHRGFMVDEARLLRGIEVLESAKESALANMPWVSQDGEGSPLSLPAMKRACREAGVEPPVSTSEDSQECRKWEIDHPEIPYIRAIRQFRKSNILFRRMEIMRDRRKPDGRFPFAMKYGGAHTLRWSGGSVGGTGEKGFNVQNFPKEPMWFQHDERGCTFIEDKALIAQLEKLQRDDRELPWDDFPYCRWDEDGNCYESVDLRACVIAGPGKKLVISDLAQIEPRVIRWLLGDTETLELIKRQPDGGPGMSIYEVHARKTMGWTGGNIKKEDPKKQFIAKQRVLALGYQCGHVKFRNRCLELEVDIPLLESKTIVKDFRKKEAALSRLWNKLDSEFKQTYMERRRFENGSWPANLPEPSPHHQIELPNGRVLNYFFVHQVESKPLKKGETEKPKTNKFRSEKPIAAYDSMGGRLKFLYGGLLLENIVQSISRDIMADGMINIEEDGHQFLFTVHDEAVVEVDEHVTALHIQDLMEVTPDWADGLPVEAEAHESTYYDK